MQFIEIVEDTAAYDQPEQQQKQCSNVKHPNQHSDMIYCKQRGTEYVGCFPSGILFKRHKTKAAEKEFFKKGIHQRNI